jgi:hypothetical protein
MAIFKSRGGLLRFGSYAAAPVRPAGRAEDEPGEACVVSLPFSLFERQPRLAWIDFIAGPQRNAAARVRGNFNAPAIAEDADPSELPSV